MKKPHLLLWDALSLPEPEAAEAWREWRAVAKLDDLDRSSFQMLPLLAGKIGAWVDGHPDAPVLLGICRRAWSQRQMTWRAIRQAVETLDQAGIRRVAAVGPLVWGELYWPQNSIRPASHAELLIDRESLAPAVNALSRAGWTRAYARPNFFVHMRSSSGEVRLNTRPVPIADLPFLRTAWPEFETIQLGGMAVAIVPPEYALVTILAGYIQDGVDWRCDALSICRATLINWDRVAVLLRWRTGARRRLRELRDFAPADIQAGAGQTTTWRRPFEAMAGWLRKAYGALALRSPPRG